MLASRDGAWLIAAGALAGALISLYDYFTPLTGIDGTPGALLVIASTLILLCFALMLAFLNLGTGFRRFLLFGAFVDILGTSFAAYLLESQALLWCMAFAFLGWLLVVFTRRPAFACALASPDR